MTYNLDLGVKSAVKEWMNDRYEHWIKQPVEIKTLELENFLSQQVQKTNNYNLANYYHQQPTFYQGLFWITVALLIILWLISG